MSTLTDRLYLLEYKEKMKEKGMQERQKQIEKIQRKKEQESERKQYEKDLLLSCKMDLKNIFEQEFELQGLKAKYHFFNISTRNSIINSMAKSVLEGDYLETNYNKILNETIKKYELHKEYQEERDKEIAEEYVKKMKPIWEEERKKQEIKNVKNNILLSVFKIFEHPFILLILTVLGVLIWIFMGALELGFFKAFGLSIITFIVLIGIFFRIYKIKKRFENLLFLLFLPSFLFHVFQF